jgi:hypothetical protein
VARVRDAGGCTPADYRAGITVFDEVRAVATRIARDFPQI